MCGITGIYDLRGKQAEPSIIKNMTASLAHRGPDDEGEYYDGNLGFGHRRLSIIDLSKAGHQPMSTKDGKVVITYNGEIYNFKEIRKELEEKGHSFFSNTDTEVIINGYKEWGLEIVPKLNGMFAFALWDAEKKELYIARDRYGIKPLYFWLRDGRFVFASEIKAILAHPDYKVDLNYNALNEYFSFQNLFRFHTLFKGIELLAPAKILTIKPNGDINSRTYWDYDFTKRDKTITEEDAVCETLQHFKDAVKRQMVGDVRVGSYLSGGMDSGSITAVASSETERLATFTCGFDMSAVTGRESNFDERKDAEIISGHYKTEHYQQVINAGDIRWSMPRLIWHLEDLRLGMSYPNFYISGLASKFVKVCLSGAGGDELYGGYPWRYYRVFNSINRDEFFKEYYNFWQRTINDNQKAAFYSEKTLASIDDERSMFDVFSRVFTFNESLKYDTPEDYIADSLYFEAKTFLHGLFVLGDKLSMAHSLEERFPFMDNDLVDFAQRVPIRYKLSNLEQMKKVDENELKKLRNFQMQFDDGKNVLRKAMSSFMPESIIRRKKQGFSAPDESWYRGENLAYVEEILLGKDACYKEYINPDFVKKVIDEHVNLKINHRLLIWSLLSFEWWCRIFLMGHKPE
ncbi:MAG: asparagine synthase (glutamine-hydrolyzing) [Ignavibacteriae bacterium]|nr:asparagine synthase (glutamine-hydrolyzing) [Ignavibacteriota bacterium]